MENIKHTKTNDEQRNKIIKYYEKGYTLNKIAEKIYEEEKLDISVSCITVLINEYCEKNNILRKRNKSGSPRKGKLISEMSKEEIKESLIQSLKQGRPCSMVYQIAQRYEINIDEELKQYGFFVKKTDQEIER